MKIPSALHPKTDKSLSNVTFIKEDIKNVLQILDSQGHGHDMISIRMLKIYNKSIINSTQIIYKPCLEKGCFPDQWKEAKAVPVHKKNDKQLSSNISIANPR